MFENFLGPKTPEQREETLRKTAEKVFKRGVNKATIYIALEALRQRVKELNKKSAGEPLDITDNYLLNIVKDEALANSDIMEDTLYGGAGNTNRLIQEEIESLRKKSGGEEPQD